MDFYLVDDPREKPLRDAVYRSIARLTERRESLRSVPAQEPEDSMAVTR